VRANSHAQNPSNPELLATRSRARHLQRSIAAWNSPFSLYPAARTMLKPSSPGSCLNCRCIRQHLARTRRRQTAKQQQREQGCRGECQLPVASPSFTQETATMTRISVVACTYAAYRLYHQRLMARKARRGCRRRGGRFVPSG